MSEGLHAAVIGAVAGTSTERGPRRVGARRLNVGAALHAGVPREPRSPAGQPTRGEVARGHAGGRFGENGGSAGRSGVCRAVADTRQPEDVSLSEGSGGEGDGR